MDIDKKCRGDPEDCFRECMSAWLRGEDNVKETEGGPSWLSLVSALETVNECDIATKLREKYLK